MQNSIQSAIKLNNPISYICTTMPNDYPQYWPQFFTATILNWQPLLQNNTYKDEIVKCLQFLVAQSV
ncbi:MAG: hypothetical protein IPP48_10780 [Chitinophagaceae bacterium]|nr:hypothetical protein [Chitinophagaceae bacterium]